MVKAAVSQEAANTYRQKDYSAPYSGVVYDKAGRIHEDDDIAKITGSGRWSRELTAEGSNTPIELTDEQWSALAKTPKSNGWISDKYGNMIYVPELTWDYNPLLHQPSEDQPVYPSADSESGGTSSASKRKPIQLRSQYVMYDDDGDWYLGETVDPSRYNYESDITQDELSKLIPGWDTSFMAGEDGWGDIEDLASALTEGGRGYSKLVGPGSTAPNVALQSLFEETSADNPSKSEDEIWQMIDSAATDMNADMLASVLLGYYNPDDPDLQRRIRALGADWRWANRNR